MGHCQSDALAVAGNRAMPELRPHKLPQGSKDPNNRVLGPNDYNVNGIWAPRPCYLGPWTLRVRISLLGPQLLPHFDPAHLKEQDHIKAPYHGET